MCYVTLNGKSNVNEQKARLDTEEIPQRQQLRYLGSITNQDGEIGEDVNIE